MRSLSIITPCYNEEEIIVDCINETYNNAKDYFEQIEYIIVNDGSVDKTLSLINTHFSQNTTFKILDKPNGGIGSAFNAGLKLCNNEYLICIPADSPLDKETANSFFKYKEDYDILTGYRTERKGYSIIMKLNSIVFHFLVSLLFKMNLKDYNWIHLYKTKIFNGINVDSNGLFMLAEILIKAKRKGFVIQEVEVEQRKRLTGIATASKPSAVLKTIKEIFSTFIKINF